MSAQLVLVILSSCHTHIKWKCEVVTQCSYSVVLVILSLSLALAHNSQLIVGSHTTKDIALSIICSRSFFLPSCCVAICSCENVKINLMTLCHFERYLIRCIVVHVKSTGLANESLRCGKANRSQHTTMLVDRLTSLIVCLANFSWIYRMA